MSKPLRTYAAKVSLGEGRRKCTMFEPLSYQHSQSVCPVRENLLLTTTSTHSTKRAPTVDYSKLKGSIYFHTNHS